MTSSAADRHEIGQSAIEFAIIGMVMVLLFAGTIDFSRFMYYQMALTGSARVAAQLAGEPCATQALCGRTKINTDDYIQQAAICQAQPYMSIESNMTSVSGFSCNNCITGTCVSPCGSSACPASAGPCSNNDDICVLRCPAGYTSESQCSNSVSPAKGQTVIIYVGYNFNVITPVMSKFFTTRACWSGDTKQHNLCARAVIRVFK